MIDLTQLNKFYIDDFVKDIFIGTLQQLFYQNPSEFHWDPDDDNTRLIITDQFSTDNLTPEFKPTIYIRRRPLGFMHTSIDKLLSANLNTGAKTYTDLMQGVVELVAVCREGLEACRLAGLVFLLLSEFTQEIRALGMYEVSVKSLGEEEPKDVRSTFRIVEVPVTIQFVFQYTWMKETMENTILNGISIGDASPSNISPLEGGGSNATNGGTPMNDITVGRSTDPITGLPLTGVPGTPCNPNDGTDVGECPTCSDSLTKICIPITEKSPISS